MRVIKVLTLLLSFSFMCPLLISGSSLTDVNATFELECWASLVEQSRNLVTCGTPENLSYTPVEFAISQDYPVVFLNPTIFYLEGVNVTDPALKSYQSTSIDETIFPLSAGINNLSDNYSLNIKRFCAAQQSFPVITSCLIQEIGSANESNCTTEQTSKLISALNNASERWGQYDETCSQAFFCAKDPVQECIIELGGSDESVMLFDVLCVIAANFDKFAPCIQNKTSDCSAAEINHWRQILDTMRSRFNASLVDPTAVSSVCAMVNETCNLSQKRAAGEVLDECMFMVTEDDSAGELLLKILSVRNGESVTFAEISDMCDTIRTAMDCITKQLSISEPNCSNSIIQLTDLNTATVLTYCEMASTTMAYWDGGNSSTEPVNGEFTNILWNVSDTMDVSTPMDTPQYIGYISTASLPVAKELASGEQPSPELSSEDMVASGDLRTLHTTIMNLPAGVMTSKNDLNTTEMINQTVLAHQQTDTANRSTETAWDQNASTAEARKTTARKTETQQSTSVLSSTLHMPMDQPAAMEAASVSHRIHASVTAWVFGLASTSLLCQY